MLDGLFHFLNSNASAVQTIVVVLALGYAAWQTRQVGRQLKLSNITSASQYFRDQNELLLRDKEARELRHETVQGCLADLYFGLFKARWALHKAHLLDNATWQADLVTMRDIFAESGFLAEEWGKRKRWYAKPFAKFIDQQIVAELPRKANKVEHIAP